MWDSDHRRTSGVHTHPHTKNLTGPGRALLTEKNAGPALMEHGSWKANLEVYQLYVSTNTTGDNTLKNRLAVARGQQGDVT